MRICFWAGVLLLLCGCGTTRVQRLRIYGTVLDVAGHPELGGAARAVARTLESTGMEVNVNTHVSAGAGSGLGGK